MLSIPSIQELTVSFHDRIVGTLSLTPDNKLSVFEYSPAWLADGFSISPLELPLKPGKFIAKPFPFHGNFGIFEDSLPDGYGRYLLRKTLLKEGIDSANLSLLQHLAIVGDNGMGALSYAPKFELSTHPSIMDFDLLQEKALEVLREYQDDDAEMLLYNSGNSGGARPKAVFSDTEGHWLVKFRHVYDPKDIGRIELKYNATARKAGIDVPDFKLVNNRYFATKRFDISPDGERIHIATAGALLSVAHSTPILDYSNLLALTGWLTQNKDEVEQMFRRMIFNYLVENKDDHSKNFSFLVRKNNAGKWEWRLAPAYDLTLCTTGYNGEHATSVNSTGIPSIQDFITVGRQVKLSAERCARLIDEVTAASKEIKRYNPK